MFLEPDVGLALFVIRLALGVVLLARGPKTVAQYAQKKAIPTATAITGTLDSIAAALMLLGIGVQIAASIIVITRLRDIFIKTEIQDKPFSGRNGWETDFLIIACAVTLLISYSEAYSLNF